MIWPCQISGVKIWLLGISVFIDVFVGVVVAVFLGVLVGVLFGVEVGVDVGSTFNTPGCFWLELPKHFSPSAEQKASTPITMGRVPYMIMQASIVLAHPWFPLLGGRSPESAVFPRSLFI